MQFCGLFPFYQGREGWNPSHKPGLGAAVPGERAELKGSQGGTAAAELCLHLASSKSNSCFKSLPTHTDMSCYCLKQI